MEGVKVWWLTINSGILLFLSLLLSLLFLFSLSLSLSLSFFTHLVVVADVVESFAGVVGGSPVEQLS